MKSRLVQALVVGLGVMSAPALANAATYLVDFSGTDSLGAVTAQMYLDVVGGNVVSGTGTITTAVSGGQGWGTANLTFLSSPSLAYTFGFNGGTNINGVDNVFPIDSNGLVFDVGPTGLNGWREAGAGFALWAGGPLGYQAGLFDNVGTGHEWEYPVNGSAAISEVPLPAALPLFGLAIAALGAYGLARHSKPA